MNLIRFNIGPLDGLRFGALGVPIVAACLLCITVSLASAQIRAKTVGSNQLRSLIPGATVHLDTPIGTVVPVTYAQNGTMRGSAGAVAAYLGSSTDKGRWWVKRGKLCHRWNVWFKRKTSCMRIKRAGRRIFIQHDDGDTNTATIVAMRAKPKHKRPISRPKIPQTRVARAAPAKPQVAQKAAQKPIAQAQVAQRTVALATTAPAITTTRPATRTRVETTDEIQMLGAAPQQGTSNGVRPARPTHVAQLPKIPTQPLPEDVQTIASKPIVSKPAPQRLAALKPVQQRQQVQPQAAPQPRRLRAARIVKRRAPLTRQPVTTYRVVRVRQDDELNIRRKPTQNATIVGAIPPNGKKIRITGPCTREWCPITHRRRAGWVHRFYIAEDTTRLAGASGDDGVAQNRWLTVMPGDTLTKLSRIYGVPVRRIMRANKLPNTALRAGQTLVIP